MLEKELSIQKLIIVEPVFDNSSVIRIILWFCDSKLGLWLARNVPRTQSENVALENTNK